MWLGLVLCVTALAPVLILPNRMSGAYLYLPLAGVAIAGTLLIREKRHLPMGPAGTVGEHLAGAVEPDGVQRVLE